MIALASASELADRLGISFSKEEEERADRLLLQASGLVRQETGQTISLVADDELLRRGSAERSLRLPQRPVVSVAAVALGGQAIAAGEWHLEGDVLVRDALTSRERCRDVYAGGWGFPSEELRITYTHGYAEIPESIKVVCLEAVVRVWVNPGAVMQEGYGGERAVYLAQGTPRGLLLTDTEKETVKRALGPRARNLDLR